MAVALPPVSEPGWLLSLWVSGLHWLCEVCLWEDCARSPAANSPSSNSPPALPLPTVTRRHLMRLTGTNSIIAVQLRCLGECAAQLSLAGGPPRLGSLDKLAPPTESWPTTLHTRTAGASLQGAKASCCPPLPPRRKAGGDRLAAADWRWKEGVARLMCSAALVTRFFSHLTCCRAAPQGISSTASLRSLPHFCTAPKLDQANSAAAKVSKQSSEHCPEPGTHPTIAPVGGRGL